MYSNSIRKFIFHDLPSEAKWNFVIKWNECYKQARKETLIFSKDKIKFNLVGTNLFRIHLISSAYHAFGDIQRVKPFVAQITI